LSETINPYVKVYLSLAFGTNEGLYPEIDKKYMKDRTYFYELSKNSEISKWSCFQSLSTKQEENVRKCIGILEDSFNNDPKNTMVMEWIKKGYKKVWNYARTHRVLSLTELFSIYLGKRKTYTLLELQNITSILVYLQDYGNLDTEWDHSDPQNHYMTEALENFTKPATRELHIKHFNKNIDEDAVQELRQQLHLDKYPYQSNIYILLENILRHEANELGLNEVFDDIASTNVKKRKLFKRGLSKYKVLVEKFFMVNGIHKFVGESMTISQDEINFILSFCANQIKELKLEEDVRDLFLISCLFFTIVIKEYRHAKALYLDQSQEDLHLSLQKQREELGKRQKQLEKKEINLSNEIKKLKDKNTTQAEEIKKLEKEVQRLHLLLDKEEDNTKELKSLRELLFNLDKMEETFINTVSHKEMINEIQQYKIVFIGGHINLHKKLKEQLPTIRFLDIDKLGTNLSFVDNYDFVIVDVNYLSHAFYYKLMSQIAKNNTALHYLTRKQNIEMIIEEIYGVCSNASGVKE
jgi:hypothetical protein